MLSLKSGVSVKGLCPEIIIAIIIADQIYNKYGCQLTITAGTDGHHMATSLHYSGQAVDLRTSIFRNGLLDKVCDEIRSSLNQEYDVVLESDHLHIEYDPRPKNELKHA